jgi:Flp pilus assembly protein TadG
MMSQAFSLVRDERGGSIVELALFMPFLGTLMLGMVDLGQGLSARHDLQQAANQAMQLALTRDAVADEETGEPDYTFVRQAAASAAGVALSQVTLTRWRECNGTLRTPYKGVCAAGEEVARYVRVRVASTYVPSFRYGPIALSSAANRDGTVPMTAEAALRIQ